MESREEEDYFSVSLPLVSLIILPYDNLEFFTRAVESIYENTDYPNFQIIVAHNPCENDETNEKIKKFCKDKFNSWNNFKYVINKENLHHSLGLMEGFKITDSESKYIVLANDDIFIPGNQIDWLTKMVDFMDKDNNVATVTPCLLYPKETIYWIGKQNPENSQHDFLHLPRNDERLPKESLTTCYNNMALCLTRRYLLKEIPLGQSCPHYGSDSEFANRIKDKYPKMKHWVIPKIKIYHFNIYNLRENHGKDPVTDG